MAFSWRSEKGCRQIITQKCKKEITMLKKGMDVLAVAGLIVAGSGLTAHSGKSACSLMFRAAFRPPSSLTGANSALRYP